VHAHLSVRMCDIAHALQALLQRNEARGAAREYPIATAGINACKLVRAA
jgi:hypothetical protein